MRGQAITRTRHWIFLSLSIVMAVAVGLVANIGLADSLRITSWNLNTSFPDPNSGPALDRAAATLRAANPDVILLQGIEDWKMCRRLVQMLQPADYNILVCSTFQGSSINTTGQMQVAILAKQKGYFTWCEPWTLTNQPAPPEGTAFAAIEAAGQRVGLFTISCRSQENSDHLAQRMLEEIDLIQRWETNRIQAFIVAGALDANASSSRTLRRAAAIFKNAGLINAAEELSTAEINNILPGIAESGGNLFFAGPIAFPFPTQIAGASFVDRPPITYEVELDPDKVAAAVALQGEDQRDRRGANGRFGEHLGNRELTAIGLGVLVLIGGWWFQRRKKNARVAALTNRPAPVRAERKIPSGQIRPIILAEPPPNKTVRPPGPQPIVVRRIKPVLRLQTRPKEQQDSEPASQQPPAAPAEEDDKRDLEKHAPAQRAQSFAHILRPADEPENSTRHGLIKEWSAWLKSKVLRRLVVDRAQLMEAQQLATHMANTLDSRLARIEAQLQHQNQDYVRRIEELNHELAAAREENRALIRERIAQVKAEMEAARAKLLAEADLDNSSLRL